MFVFSQLAPNGSPAVACFLISVESRIPRYGIESMPRKNGGGGPGSVIWTLVGVNPLICCDALVMPIRRESRPPTNLLAVVHRSAVHCMSYAWSGFPYGLLVF